MRYLGISDGQWVTVTQRHIPRTDTEPLLGTNAPQVGEVLPFAFGPPSSAQGRCVRVPLCLQVRKVLLHKGIGVGAEHALKGFQAAFHRDPIAGAQGIRTISDVQRHIEGKSVNAGDMLLTPDAPARFVPFHHDRCARDGFITCLFMPANRWGNANPPRKLCPRAIHVGVRGGSQVLHGHQQVRGWAPVWVGSGREAPIVGGVYPEPSHDADPVACV